MQAVQKDVTTPARSARTAAGPRLTDYRTAEVKVGNNHGAPRVWLEGKRLERAGFHAGTRYELEVAGMRVTLRVAADGTRIVSAKKKNDQPLPVIDINSAASLSVFEGLDRVRVVIRENEIHLLPLASQAKARERLNRVRAKVETGEALSVGSLCHGGGGLSLALHTGMKAGGVTSKLAFANDLESDVLEQARDHNPLWNEETTLVAAPMQEIVTDEWLLKQLGHVDVLEAGIPCTAASVAGRAKKHLPMAEADPNAGHLVVPFLGIVEALQPAVILIENVPPYLNTASAHLLRHTLRDWGYQVQETVLAAGEFGALEDRKRMAMVAVTQGLSFEMDWIEKPEVVERKLGDLLDDVPLDAPCWSEMSYLRDKEVRDREAGKGFRMQILTSDSTSVGTLGSGYAKNRSTEGKIAHPTEGDRLLRLFTPSEHARIKGMPPELIEDMPATRAHALLGNGVVFEPFLAMGKALAKAILSVRPQPLALVS